VIGDHEPLLFNPVNRWTGTLLAAIALDLTASTLRNASNRCNWWLVRCICASRHDSCDTS
jgi:hypothetical protein